MSGRSSSGRAARRTDLWPRFWRRRPILLAAAVLLGTLAVWARLRVPFGSDHDRYHNRMFTCVRVVDGDTIDIDAPDGRRHTTRIRLWGVDTPETVKNDRPAMYYGPEAAQLTKSLVESQLVRVVLAPDTTREKYGRLLAYVYLGDGETMLNEQLIVQGCAYADTRFEHVWRQRFLELEKRARKQKMGLWAGVSPEQMPPWRQRYEAWKGAK